MSLGGLLLWTFFTTSLIVLIVIVYGFFSDLRRLLQRYISWRKGTR